MVKICPLTDTYCFEKVSGQLQLCVPHCWGVIFKRGRHSFGHGFDLQSVYKLYKINSKLQRTGIIAVFNRCKKYVFCEDHNMNLLPFPPLD